jgi:hypothetical protein
LLISIQFQDEKKGPILKSLISKGAQIRHGDVSSSAAELASALKNIDVIVSAYSGPSLVSEQQNLLNAAVKAGVKRFIPSDYIGDLSKHKYVASLGIQFDSSNISCLSPP